MKKTKIFLPFVALALTFGLVACGGAQGGGNNSSGSKAPASSQQPAKPKITVTAAGDKKTLAEEETVQLSAKEGENDLTGVTWSSSAATVASVSESGLVTAIASGEATITAKKDGYSNGSITITVTRAGLLATLHMEDADHYSADGWWASSSYGPGATPIYSKDAASDGTCVAYCDNGDKETLTFASSAAIKAEMVITMAYGSSIEDLSTVESAKMNGVAINLAGKAFESGGSSNDWVEVSFGQVDLIAGDNVLLLEFLGAAPYLDDVSFYSKQTATITVKAAPAKEQIKVTNEPEGGFTVEQDQTITIQVDTAGATFVSSSEAIATVTNAGVVTGVAKGSATITIMKDGKYATRVTVKVTEKVVAGEIRVQAEDGTVDGTAVSADTDIKVRTASTGETLTERWVAGKTLIVKFNSTVAGSYKLYLSARAGGQYGMSNIDDLAAVIELKFNDAAVTIPASTAVSGRTFIDVLVGNVTLKNGENKIEVKSIGEDDTAPNIDFFKFVPNA